MNNPRRSISVSRVIDLVAFDAVTGLFLAWYVVENPRRWPALLVLIPILLLVNLLLGRRAFGFSQSSSFAMPVIYGCGLIYGICWVINGFTWWKLALLTVPLALLILSIRHCKMGVWAGGAGPGK